MKEDETENDVSEEDDMRRGPKIALENMECFISHMLSNKSEEVHTQCPFIP